MIEWLLAFMLMLVGALFIAWAKAIVAHTREEANQAFRLIIGVFILWLCTAVPLFFMV